MGLFRRISATITSSVDQAVTRVENHDAIVASAIRNTRSSAAQARVRLARVKRDGENLRNRSKELKEAQSTWEQRARAVAATDKTSALECVRRCKLARDQAARIQTSLREHDELENQVAETLRKIEARLAEMQHQRNMMRSRESVADAMRIINTIDGAGDSEVEETFDRWEVLITESEIATGKADPVDALAVAFGEAEDNAALEAELDALLKQEE